MSQETFDRLLAAMPGIAKVVNGFNSEEVQRSAFAALVQAMDATAGSISPENDQKDEYRSRPQRGKSPTNGRGQSKSEPAGVKRSRKISAKKGLMATKDLDLRPEGKQSFREFADEEKSC